MKYEIKDLNGFKAIHVIGNIDSTENTKILDDEIENLIKQGNRHFVFNLRRTTFLDSGGIGLFIHCLCDAQEQQGSVAIIAEENQVRRVLEVVGINRLIRLYYSEKEFVESVKSKGE